MVQVKGKVRVNRPFFFIDTKGERVEFPAQGVGEGDLDGHHLQQYNLNIKGGTIEDLMGQVEAEPEIETKEPEIEKNEVEPEQPPVVETTEESEVDMTALRAQYVEVVGKAPFPGWNAEELTRRIQEAKA